MNPVYADEVADGLPDGWSIQPFDELVYFQEGPGIRNWQYVENGVPFVNIRCLVNGKLDRQAMSKVATQEAFGKYRHFLLDVDDYVVSSSGTLGRIATVQESDLPCMLNTSVIRMRPRSDQLDRGYLKYYLLSDYYQSQVLSFATGSAQLNYGPMHLRQMFIVLPPLSEQRAIADILGALDDKIELNRKMSETLEAMARALFKSWFVDFDPARAKMEGRDPGLPNEIADLFSSRMAESELGEIPEGWRSTCVDDEFDLTMGQSPPGETYNEAGVGLPFYQGRADFEFRFPKRRVYCGAPTRFASRGDTLISVRAPVGDINMAAEDCAIGRGVAAARHKSGSRSYTYQFMHSVEEVFSRFDAEGTVFGSISKKDFHAVPCVAPTRQIIGVFEKLVAPFDSRIETALFESRTFAVLRDALLPKLISGELRVKDARGFNKATR